MSTGLRGWKTVLCGVLAGLLAASSTAGTPHGVSARAAIASPEGGRFVFGVEHRTLLPDGRLLVLGRDGQTLTLREGQGGKVIRERILPQVRKGASMTLLPSGRVLIWGGVSAAGKLQTEGLWYDPALQTLEPAAGLPLAARAAHTATVLTDGRLLLAGGQSAVPNAEVWDERTQQVSAVSPHGQDARVGHTARLQTDGKVRLSGGTLAGRPLANSAWFAPELSSFVEVADAEAPVTAALGIAGSIPEQGAKHVSPDARLAVRFSQPVRMQDINAATVTLLGPGGLATLHVVPAEGGKLAFATPQQDLFPDSKYTLLVEGVRTRAGKVMPLMAVDFQTAHQDAASVSPTNSARADDVLPATQQRMSTGASDPLAPACQTAAGRKAPCRKQSQLKNGVWTPGQDNTDGRWRLPGNQPELRNAGLIATLTQAMGFTTVMGRILRVDGTPVAGVNVSVGKRLAQTDAAGHFMVHGAPAGKQELYVDGSSANMEGVEYGQFVVGLDVKAGQLTQLPYTMYLPRISARDKVRIPSPLTRDTVLTHPDMPGLQILIPEGTVIRDRKGKLVTELAIVPTPVNRAPFPVADNYPMYFTLEPGGALIQGLTPESAKGIRLFYPNYDGYPAGTQANFWIYDPNEGWQVYGKGRVTSDGSRFAPEAGVALHQTMGGSYSVTTNDPPTEPDQPPCSEACGSSGSGAGATAGDPIDLYTGEFFYSEMDVAISDVVPMTVARSYRPNDFKKREFGVGTTANFGYRLYSEPNAGYNTMQLILPSGVPVNFVRTSGTGLTGSWAQTGSTTAFGHASMDFVSDSKGKGYRVTLRNGSIMHFGNFAPNPLNWTEDKHGNRTEYVYDAGLLTRIVSPSGRYLSLEYDTSNRVKFIRNLLGQTWGYEYNSIGLLSKVTYPDSTFKRYEYRVENLLGQPARARLESIYDQKNHRILHNEFEVVGMGVWSGRVVKQTQADGGVYSINYAHSDGSTTGTLVTNPDGSKRRVVFDAVSHYPLTDTVGYGTPLAQTTTFERDGAGRVTAQVDPLGRRSEYQYNSQGQVTRVTYLAGTAQARSVSVSYNAEGDPVAITDPLNRTTNFGYTQRCLTSITNPANETASLTCNLAGQPTSAIDPLGNTTRMKYDGHDLMGVLDPLGRQTSLRYDMLGRGIAMQDAAGNMTRREFDVMGRVSKLVDASGNVTEIGYDANGNVSAILLPHGNGIIYTYDSRNRLLTRADSLGQVEQWTYDAMDRATSYTDRKGQVTEFDYDVLGRLTTTTYANSTVTATYDAGNRLLALVDTASGTLSWTYDDFDQVIQASSPQGNITYEYDAAGRRTGMIAAGQPKAEYQYDLADRLVRLLQGSDVVDFDYDLAGRLVGTTLPNGIKAAYAYNASSQVTGIAWVKPDNTLLGNLGYGYDALGRRVAQTGTFASPQLPAASTGPNSFDDNNRQTQHNGQALSYDANGNMTSDGSRIYVWNERNQLAEIKVGTSTIATFTYDALGRRYSKTETGQSVTYLYDGLDAVQETQEATVNPILTGLGIDQRYARNESGNRTYFLTDALGSTRALTNASGDVVQRYDYAPYGQTSQLNAGTTNPYQYTGREKDASGLYYYRARYYSTNMSRFIAEDPIGLADGPNAYAYVGGNPVMYYDPLGLWAWGDPLPQGLVDFSAAFGDTISFGATDVVRDWMGTNGAVDRCSGSYSAGEWAGIGFGFAAGGAAGWRAAGVKAKGLEFSHWIPNRMGGPHSLWNGNYVTTVTHALSDPYRYRFMPKVWKASNPMPSQLAQQWVRIPNVYKGAAGGGAAAGASAAMTGCGCS
jgi:RHS repeat-associated protein